MAAEAAGWNCACCSRLTGSGVCSGVAFRVLWAFPGTGSGSANCPSLYLPGAGNEAEGSDGREGGKPLPLPLPSAAVLEAVASEACLARESGLLGQGAACASPAELPGATGSLLQAAVLSSDRLQAQRLASAVPRDQHCPNASHYLSSPRSQPTLEQERKQVACTTDSTRS